MCEVGRELVGRPQGWKCPYCGRVYSHFHPMCLYCVPSRFRSSPQTADITLDQFLERIRREGIHPLRRDDDAEI